MSQCLSLSNSKISAQVQTELVIALVYCIAIESGFAAIETFEKYSLYSKIKIGYSYSYHSENVRTLSQYYPEFTVDTHRMLYTLQMCQTYISENADIAQCRLTCVVSGDFLIVTLTPNLLTEARGGSACLSIGRYVLSAVSKTKSVYHRLRKLQELSYIMREKVFVPVRNQQLNIFEGRTFSYPSLIGLPEDLYFILFRLLNRLDIKSLAKTCRRLRTFYHGLSGNKSI